VIVLALRARSCIALEPANPPVLQANPLVTSIHLFYFSTGLWDGNIKMAVKVDNTAPSSFLSLVRHGKFVRNRFPMSFAIPLESNVCKGGNERIFMGKTVLNQAT